MAETSKKLSKRRKTRPPRREKFGLANGIRRVVTECRNERGRKRCLDDKTGRWEIPEQVILARPTMLPSSRSTARRWQMSLLREVAGGERR